MSTLTDACEQLKVYIIFVKAAVVFLCSYSGTSSTCNTRRGWRNQHNSCHPSKSFGKKPCVPTRRHPGSSARPHQCEWWFDTTSLGKEHEPPPVRAAAVSHHPSSVCLAWTRDADPPRVSRAWAFRDTEPLQHLFTLCGVTKPQYCWK